MEKGHEGWSESRTSVFGQALRLRLTTRPPRALLAEGTQFWPPVPAASGKEPLLEEPG